MESESVVDIGSINPWISIAIVVFLFLLVIVLVRQITLIKKYKKLKNDFEERDIENKH
ncbi:hypothetical protein ACFQ1M_05895 [Sungkyunkwania multivorans]|uniref:ATP synthase F0 subunit 8 n=1 Tax=Sungkyunkwania multivorans TaxID=1173618 RepID=A0ABW3CW29_9FLAO